MSPDTRPRLAEALNTISADREVALLEQAGFVESELFYAAMAWRGWIASVS